MQLTNLLTSLAVLRLAAAAPAVASKPERAHEARQVPVQPCSTGVHVIAAGGKGTANPKDYGLLGSLSTNILGAIPGSTNVSLPYDKLNVAPGTQAIPDGIQTLRQYVTDYKNACPNTKQVLVGYSSGAIITMSGLCEGVLDPSLNGNTIIATVVYGDQTHVPNQPYNRGTCPAGAGKSPRDPADCGAFAANIQSYCNQGDPECCGGNDPNVHFSYPGQYDQVATQFVVSKFNGT